MSSAGASPNLGGISFPRSSATYEAQIGQGAGPCLLTYKQPRHQRSNISRPVIHASATPPTMAQRGSRLFFFHSSIDAAVAPRRDRGPRRSAYRRATNQLRSQREPDRGKGNVGIPI